MGRIKGRSVQVTTQTILNAARKRFIEFGFAETSIENIAADANVTRRTVYEYFKNKEDILQCILKMEAETYLPLLEEAHKISEPAEIIKEIFNIIFDTTLSGLKTISVEIEKNLSINIPDEAVSVSLKYIAVIEDAINKGNDSGIFKKGLNPHEIMAVMNILVVGYFARSRMIERLIKLDTHTDQAADRWKKLMSDILLDYLLADTASETSPAARNPQALEVLSAC
jgi:Transcriptional regulator